MAPGRKRIITIQYILRLQAKGHRNNRIRINDKGDRGGSIMRSASHRYSTLIILVLAFLIVGCSTGTIQSFVTCPNFLLLANIEQNRRCCRTSSRIAKPNTSYAGTERPQQLRSGTRVRFVRARQAISPPRWPLSSHRAGSRRFAVCVGGWKAAALTEGRLSSRPVGFGRTPRWKISPDADRTHDGVAAPIGPSL